MDSKQVRGMMEAYASIYEKKCVDKKDKGAHNCAKKVCHEQYGEGECIFGQHAVPDENGFVSHYDVQFEHGIVENVSVEELEIITEGSHNEENHRYEGEMIDEADNMDAESVDVFDVIKGHLIDEGYADSEEAALAIMTNMSENWKESILLELTPLGTRAAGAVDDQRRGSTMAKDMMLIQKNLRKLNRPKGPTVMPTLPGV